MFIVFFLLMLFPAYGWAGVPPTLNTWYPVPNTQLSLLCPDFDTFNDCKRITIAWGSAAFDQGNVKFYLWGGGHNDYWGNEFYEFNANTLTLIQKNPPTTPVAANGTAPDCLTGSDGVCVSNSKHDYDGLVWMEELHKGLLIGGSPAKNGGLANSIWVFDPQATTSAARWVRLTDSYVNSGAIGSGRTNVQGVQMNNGHDYFWSTAYALWTKPDGTQQPIVYAFNSTNLYAIDPVANTMKSLTNRAAELGLYVAMMYDPVRKVLVIAGSGAGANGIRTFDVSGGPTTQVPGSGDGTLVPRPTTGATSVTGTAAPGGNYDIKLDRWVFWGSCTNPANVYLADPDKMLANDNTAWTTVVTTGAQAPDIEPQPGCAGQHGINGRMAYANKQNIYYYFGDATKNVYALRLSAPDNTIRVKETSGSTQTNRPVSFGRPFRQGDIANCPEAWINGAAVITQTDVKSRWSDGSLKFGIVSFVAASLSANSTTTVTFINNQVAGACHNTGGLTQSQALAGYDFDVVEKVVGSSTKTASARTMLNNGNWVKWLDGPVVTSFILEDKSAARIYDMDPNADGARALHPQYQCDFYPSLTSVYCSVVLENDWISNSVGNSTRDEAITYSITAGNAAPVAKIVNWAGDTSEAFTGTNEVGNPRKFTGMSRSHITVWVGTAPGNILIDHNLSYLGSTRLLPNYDSSLSLNATRLANEKSAWSSLTTSRKIQGKFDYNGSTGSDPIGSWERRGADGGGGHPWVGLFPTWDTMYLYAMSGFDQTMQDKFYGNADLLGRLQVHMRELDVPAGRGQYFDNAYSSAHTPALGRHLSISARKEVSTQDFSDTCSGTIGIDKINQNATIEWTSYSPRWAPHHSPGADYLQYLLSGRYFYLEETQMQAAYYLAWAHGCVGSGRQGDKGYFAADGNNEVRGAAWAYRSMIYAYTVSTDSTPEKSYWDWYVKQNLALLEGQSGISNTDAQHVTAYNYGTATYLFADGSSPTGEWTRYLDGTGYVRFDGTPSRNVTGCNGTPGTDSCSNAPWMENFMLSAIGMAYGTGLDTYNLLKFRARYNFGPSLSLVHPPFGDEYRFSGKVELSYAGGSGQGWFPGWSFITQYVNDRTAFTVNGGSDQRYQFIFLGAAAFLGPVVGVYGSDGVTAYYAYRTALNAAQPLTAQFDGSLSSGDPTYDSPKWDILPWQTTSVATSIPTLPQPPTAPSNVVDTVQ